MEKTFHSILKIGCHIEHALKDAMVLCQSWGYNGFKRLYRYYNNCIHHDLICLRNEMFDNHDIVAIDEYPTTPYLAANLKEHCEKWLMTLRDACRQLAMLNVELVKQTGYQSCEVKDILKDLYKLKEKARRTLVRFEKCNWMEHDIHVYDDLLHHKMKKKEEKHK